MSFEQALKDFMEVLEEFVQAIGGNKISPSAWDKFKERADAVSAEAPESLDILIQVSDGLMESLAQTQEAVEAVSDLILKSEASVSAMAAAVEALSARYEGATNAVNDEVVRALGAVHDRLDDLWKAQRS